MIYITEIKMDPLKLYQVYSEAGFTFTKDLITNYCLSLYTKPFVILSGISGTGKTKIAQLFRPFEPIDESSKVQVDSSEIIPTEDYILLKLTDGILYGDGRGNFKVEDLPLLLTADEYEKYEEEKQKLLRQGGAENFSSVYDIFLILDGVEYKISFYIQRAKSPLVRPRFKSKRGAPVPYDLQPILKEKYKVGDVIKLKKIEEHKFQVVEANKAEIEEESLTKPITYIDNISLIPVKSDWTDSSGIIGYYNVIENKYHIGPFLKHLLFAQANPTVPFFVILDEMNLSKIEYYLSDVLSVLETRLSKKAEENGFAAERIILHSASSSEDYIDTDDEYFDLISSKIAIPPNFYITGTINVDETTYIPSPKVLDRANVIEFNAVNLNNYFYKDVEPDTSSFILKEVPDFSLPKTPKIEYAQSIPDFSKKLIVDINNSLRKYNMHFGYRVASEISLYITNAYQYTENADSQITVIMDHQISQKILPKISGSQSRIEKPIVELFSLLTKEEINIDNIDSSIIENLDPNDTKFPISVGKLQNLYKRLIAYGFASSIE